MNISTFPDFSYERPDMEELEGRFRSNLSEFRAATSASAAIDSLKAIYQITREYTTAHSICNIRHTIDTHDPFYDTEHNFFDENAPRTEIWRMDLYRSLLDSPLRPELERHFGPQLFRIAETSLRTFHPDVYELLQEENRLTSQYLRLTAQAQIEFDGQTYNLSSIRPKEIAADRALRRRASMAKWAFFADNGEELDRIFDELVRVRTKIARTLGYDNYIGLAYDRLQRTDYGPKEVAAFRESVHKYFVPVANQLYERQQKTLGLDRLNYYDEEFRFPEGNPVPKGSPEWIVEQAIRMYDELSPETGAFFHFMHDHQLMDLIARNGKSPGGYCTFIPRYGTPYIFSNFNGTSSDIDVLTHEIGHAFQMYCSRDFEVSEYNFPTLEACEIHSMSMEFFTWPWMSLFFEEDAHKYKQEHLASAVRFLPYGVAVDEFQHRIYEQPDLSPAERHATWRAIERKYLPQRDYADNAFLEAGGFWQKQAHIFSVPFYYIDYTLAQICALQFFQRDRQDHPAAWADYLQLCQAGGSQSFLELVELAKLKAPFEESVIREVANHVSTELESMLADSLV